MNPLLAAGTGYDLVTGGAGLSGVNRNASTRPLPCSRRWWMVAIASAVQLAPSDRVMLLAAEEPVERSTAVCGPYNLRSPSSASQTDCKNPASARTSAEGLRGMATNGCNAAAPGHPGEKLISVATFRGRGCLAKRSPLSGDGADVCSRGERSARQVVEPLCLLSTPGIDGPSMTAAMPPTLSASAASAVSATP
jgi:hypothetical protein